MGQRIHDNPARSHIRSEAGSRYDITFTLAPNHQTGAGLLGRVRLKIAGFVIEPIGVHRRPDGEITFRYPDRKDQRGRRWPVAAPENRSIRERLEMEMRDVVRRELEAR
ncbi:MAG: hypothetical protein JNJ88_18185 [Planctomycetes bacterium]|nr:hypothetical protein [Planctomycetota bacterium]